MKKSDFRKYSDQANDWIENYFETLADQPVRAQVAPGDIAARISPSPPEKSESMDDILEDFGKIEIH